MENEKRQAPRIKKLLVAHYSVPAADNIKSWDVSTVWDISEKGICISTREDLAIGTELDLLIKIPFRPFEWLEAKGKVVTAAADLKTILDKCKSEASIARVAFVDLSEEQKTLIRQYVEWFLSKYGGEK